MTSKTIPFQFNAPVLSDEYEYTGRFVVLSDKVPIVNPHTQQVVSGHVGHPCYVPEIRKKRLWRKASHEDLKPTVVECRVRNSESHPWKEARLVGYVFGVQFPYAVKIALDGSQSCWAICEVPVDSVADNKQKKFRLPVDSDIGKPCRVRDADSSGWRFYTFRGINRLNEYPYIAENRDGVLTHWLFCEVAE